MSSAPTVSIVMPCRNEGAFIEGCLESIVGNEFPKERLEVLVVDGMSEDGTRSIVEKYSQRHPFIRLVDNHKKVTPAALNIGIGGAKGDIIMRMDAHVAYESNYIARCAAALDEHGVDNVGGIWKVLPRRSSAFGKGVAVGLSHRFGVGPTHYRMEDTKAPMVVDTVPFFCCRRELFDRIGTFNEDLVRGQDMELSLRIRKSGGRTLLVPDIVSHYYARSDLRSFLKHNWTNGVWAIMPFLYSAVMPVSWRHLVPLAFVVALVASAGLALAHPAGVLLLAVVAGSYLAANLAASVDAALRERDLRLVLLMPLIFAGLHIGYGLGSLWGVARLAVTPRFWGKVSRGLGSYVGRRP